MFFAKNKSKEITGKRRRPSLARAGLKQGGREREALRPSRKAAPLRARNKQQRRGKQQWAEETGNRTRRQAWSQPMASRASKKKRG
ncbi:hypothetical protein M441DRAFT_58033 [Trichoderma asperellum CBS 433.97]|uniref:Uncharacterized protein n=1 Tax=Trichoderma asperellum (strain ATCC 204424 / CBS 433.97 / NBRC 101777) TaxID=1042311 RepID=A0A2T3Z6S2_TRIA4|nr:hypothetical protein M441DRAFT_58033 [Trichoderma asperellum CBS 433.97]PTB40517.1 hypothetical protein M441DRAFT_58033 [Trichoderma asperellum CBS 433.97]